MQFAVQGIKATKSKPNPYLYQALALMATELKYTEEAREWYMEGTKTLLVCTLCYSLLSESAQFEVNHFFVLTDEIILSILLQC